MARKKIDAGEARMQRRLERRAGTVLFIDGTPDEVKEAIKERAAANGRSMVKEALAILTMEVEQEKYRKALDRAARA